MSCGGVSLEGSGAYVIGFCSVAGSFPGLRGKEGESLEEEDGLCEEEGKTESKISSPLSL